MSSDLACVQELLDRLGRGDAGAAEELIGLTVDQLYRRTRRVLNQDFPREKARGHETASVADRVIGRLHRALKRHAARFQAAPPGGAAPGDLAAPPDARREARPLNPLTTPRHYYAFVNRRIRYVLLDLCRDKHRNMLPLGPESSPGHGQRDVAPEPAASSSDQPPESAQKAEEQARLLEAIERLTPAERYLVQLQYFQDYTQEEIAKIIGRSQSNVSRKLDAIRVKLLRLLTRGPG